jgi:anaerobic magnesium-protoporphyrin IX monomethyl ester cyclase
MRIVLLNLPWRKQGRFGVRAGSRWPFTVKAHKGGKLQYVPFPFFLAYATALLNQQEHTALLIDAIAEGTDESLLLGKVRSFTPELIVIETSTPSFDNDIAIIKDLARALPGCPIALCGPHASVYPEFILERYDLVSFILIGEYETALADLAKAISMGMPLRSVPGLAFRKAGRIVITARRKALVDLDALPWPERRSLPLYNYNDGFAGLAQPNVQMQSSRGCPFPCTFCLWPQTLYFERKYRKRDPAKVIDEMESLIRDYRFKAVYFDDDLFNYDKKHVYGICSEIKKRKISIPWAVMARADLMDPEMLSCMAQAGLYAVKYGIESADQKILNACKKKMNMRKSLQAIKLTRKLGVKVHLTFCLGLPGESRASIKETREFIQAVVPDSLQFSFATPFPGTEYFSSLRESGGILSSAWPDYDGNQKCIIRTDALTNEELQDEWDALNRHYHMQ